MKEEIELKENERIDDLEYKGLKIIQNKEGFCFGIDSILLSDFAKNIKKGAKVLDLGAGTGIIATLLCGKTELSEIIGIEVQEEVSSHQPGGYSKEAGRLRRQGRKYLGPGPGHFLLYRDGAVHQRHALRRFVRSPGCGRLTSRAAL